MDTIPARDKWIESARLYIVSEDDYCECDCFLCIRDEHDEHCEIPIEDWELVS